MLGVLASSAILLIMVAVVLQEWARRSVGADSGPIIEAIRAYHSEQGAPPQNLEALVPDYLPSRPRFGLAGTSSFTYIPAPDSTDSDPWTLMVHDLFEGWTSDGDVLLFSPKSDPIERRGYGDWKRVRR